MGRLTMGSRGLNDRSAGQGMKYALLTVFILFSFAGCSLIVPTLDKVDLEAPGWRFFNGMALWNPGAERPFMAGEIIVARHENGDVLVNFSKSSLPLVTAQTAGDIWRFDILEGGRAYSGKGSPPKRIIWFFLPALIAGEDIPENWIAETTEKDVWFVKNLKTDETIRVVIER